MRTNRYCSFLQAVLQQSLSWRSSMPNTCRDIQIALKIWHTLLLHDENVSNMHRIASSKGALFRVHQLLHPHSASSELLSSSQDKVL